MPAGLKTRPLKYQRIADELRGRLRNLPPGTRLPPERQLAEQFDCNVLTVRKSLASLVDEGRIERRTGSGTFVTDHEEAGREAAPAPANRVKRTGATPVNAQMVGILALTQTDNYGQSVIQALGRVSANSDLELRMSWVADLGTSALAQAAAFRQAGCGSLILPWFPHSQIGQVAALVRDCALPVSLPMLIPGLEKNCFELPEIFGSSILQVTDALCRYMNALGHERIALLGPSNAADPILQARLSAYACAMADLGHRQLLGLVGQTSGEMDALAANWAKHRGDLAVICYDDTHALRFMTAMHKLGLSAPTDFAIVGSNNEEAGRFGDPPLTTVAQDFDYVGRCLLAHAQGQARGELSQSDSQPPQRLLVRASCGGAGKLTDQIVRDMLDHGLALNH